MIKCVHWNVYGPDPLLINRISSTYDDTTAGELERRFINAIKSGDPKKFKRGIAKVIEAKNNDTK